MMYDPGHPILFSIGGPYSPPAGAAVNFNLGVVESFKQDQGTGRPVGWKRAVRRDSRCMLPWGVHHRQDARFTSPVSGAGRIDLAGFTVSWSAPFTFSTKLESLWSTTAPGNGQPYSLLWPCPPKKYRHCGAAWDNLASYDLTVNSTWINRCNPTDFTRAIVYQDTVGIDHHVLSPWLNHLPTRDLCHRSYWGDELYARICYRSYKAVAGNALHFDLETEISHVFDGDNLHFYFETLSYDERCKQREPSGWRDNYIKVPPPDHVLLPIQKVYSYMSSMSLVKISDGTVLPLVESSVAINFDSWCYRFTAILSSEAAYLAVMPTVEGTTAVQLTINGYIFLLVVEEASETVRFGQRSWSVSGRSISAELAAPVAPVSSYTETSQRTAVQLMEQAVQNTGWTINFEGIDWLVSENALSYTDKTPIQVVKKIAEAGGCKVQTQRNNKTLNIIRRFRVNPWDWAGATPDITIPESVPRSFAHKWKGGPSYNGIYVSGTTQGVICLVRRTGTDGTPLAPMVTNPLVTATEAARELGKMHLATSGNYDIVSIDLPLSEPPGEPGLLLPGTMIEVIEKRETWKGQATSCKVTGKWNRGLVIRQQIEAERYYG